MAKMRHNEQGQALLELLLVLPLVLFLTGAIIGMGWAYWVRLNNTAYAQDVTLQAGKANDLRVGQAWAARFSAATNVDLGAETGIFWLPPYRGVRSQAQYTAPTLLLYGLNAPEIRTGAFSRWERFYGGPPAPGTFE